MSISDASIPVEEVQFDEDVGPIGAVAIPALVGGVAGGVIGSGVAGVAKLFSKERKDWKDAIEKEKTAKENAAKNPTASNKKHASDLAKEKEHLREIYIKVRNSAMKKGSNAGIIAGAATGAIIGRHSSIGT